MKAEEMLQEICTSMGYNHEPDEDGFAMLTSTRYTDIKSIPEMYVSTVDNTKVYKLTIEEVRIKDLPNEERDCLNDYIERRKELEELDEEE